MEMIDYIKKHFDDIINELGIETINPDRRYWLIRAGEKGVFFNEFYGRGFTGIGYGVNDLEILTNSTRDELKDIIEKKFPEEKQPGHIAGKIYNFMHEIKKGDVIVMPSLGRKNVAFGIIENDEVFIDNSLITGESLLEEDNSIDIPDKRRKVKWLKIVNSRFLQSKLILNLFSPHGLSGITDPEVTKLIDININDFFLKEENAYLSFQVNSEKQINLNALSNLMSVLTDISSTYLEDNQQFSVQINLNSPGKIVIYGAKVSLVLAFLVLSFLGVKFKYAKGTEECTVDTPGLFTFFKEYLSHQEKMEELNIKYIEAINQLNIEEAEKIKLIREKNKHQ